ncbi:MAG: hypothetical protein NTV68_11750, partial [Methanomicrobiales archaeon]|nr:hypothetical protein [Methanomicrobiales archaeon]
MKYILSIFFCITSILIIIVPACARNRDVTVTDNVSLIDNNVLSITIEKSGIIWFGTKHGVSKYDGKVWTTYNSKNANSGLDQVYSIAID